MEKQLLYGMLPLLFALFSSCGNEDYSEDPGNIRIHGVTNKGKPIKVRITFGGEYLTESEDPMMRAEEKSTYAGINVYRKPQPDEETPGSKDAKYEYYAYGVYNYDSNAFNALSPGIEVNLNTGYIYLFEATIFKDGTDKLAIYQNSVYRNPFGYSSDKTMSDLSFDIKKTKELIYTNSIEDDKDRYHLSQITSGTAYVDVKGDDSAGRPRLNCSYPRAKRFYGKKEYDPLKADSHTVEVEMKFRSFGLMIEVENIPEKSYLTVKDISDDKNHGDDSQQHFQLMFPKDLKLSKDGTSGGKLNWEDAYSLNKIFADNESDLEDKFDLEFTLHKADGSTKKFAANDVTVHPGKRKNLKVSIAEQNVNFTGNLIFKMEDDDLSKDDAQETQTLSWVDK